MPIVLYPISAYRKLPNSLLCVYVVPSSVHATSHLTSGIHLLATHVCKPLKLLDIKRTPHSHSPTDAIYFN